MADKALLSAQNLTVSLGGQQVVQGVDFKAAAGEYIGLLGPNGAGKTTFMRALLGLVSHGGQVTAATRPGYVPQRHDVAWDFPIHVDDCVLSGRIGQIGWFRRPGAADRAAVAEALELVQMTELAHRPIGALSGGQRQRVLIARALATQPQILLLDEPFTGLDAPNTEALLELFETLTATGTTVMMSTHNLAEAAHTCRRLVLFNRTIIADGPAPEILSDAQVWSTTFGVSAHSPLLSAIGVNAC